MTKKLVVIDKCDDCPYFDHQYYGYKETCVLLSRKIKSVEEPLESDLYETYKIPKDCPLADTEAEVNYHGK